MKRNSLYLYKALGGAHGAPYAVISSDLDLQLHAGCCSREALNKLLRLNDSKRRSNENTHTQDARKYANMTKSSKQAIKPK